MATPNTQTPLDWRQILGASRAQVDSELSGQIAPLQSQAGLLGTRQQRAQQDIGRLFQGLQPSVERAAGEVSQSYDQAQQAQKAIFAEANQRLAQQRQQQSQEAQAMAQQVGGPVAVEEFDAGLASRQTALGNIGAGTQLNTLAHGQAGVEQAQAFAGRVFPLLRTEESAKSRKYYEDQISTINDQITSLKASRTSKVNARANEMLLAERQFALQKAQQDLARLTANREYQLGLRRLEAEEKQLEDRALQNELAVAGVTGTFRGKPTIQARSLSADEKRAAAAAGLSEREFQLRKQDLMANTSIRRQQLAIAQRTTAAQYLEHALNPEPGKTVTITKSVPATSAQALAKAEGVYADNKSPTGYSRLVRVTEQLPSATPITNANQLIDYLKSQGVPPKVALSIVKQRLGLSKDWVPGMADPHEPVGPYANPRG